MENIEKCGNCVYFVGYRMISAAENGSTGSITNGVCQYNDQKICVCSENGCARWRTNEYKRMSN